jgi:hypothetical protein
LDSSGEGTGSSNGEGAGSYDWWNIPTIQPLDSETPPPGSDYQIKVTSIMDSSYSDTSDNHFSIQEECVQAGQISRNASLGSSIYNGKCCADLLEIDNGLRYQPGACTNSYPNPNCTGGGCVSLEGAGMICSACGNGTCEKWENFCNCPSDCSLDKPLNQQAKKKPGKR